jgi:accessory gene regulator protein AgrB
VPSPHQPQAEAGEVRTSSMASRAGTVGVDMIVINGVVIDKLLIVFVVALLPFLVWFVIQMMIAIVWKA